MVETTTKNYGWTKPELTKSSSTWGGFLNTDLDSIDAIVFSNQQAAAPIGAGALWFTPTPPANWLICDGRSLDTTVYAGLFAIFGYTYGGSGPNFNLPPLANAFPMGSGTKALAATGGEATHLLTAAELAAHTHTATQAAHGHAATQAAHSHSVSTGGHSHTISTGSHAHSVPGVVIGGGAGIGFGANYAQTGTASTSTAGDLGGSTSAAGDLGGSTSAATPAITVPTATPVITVAATAAGAAHNNLPPFVCINFIVRYQ